MKTSRRYYLAYGSNLNLEQMQWRCPDARVVGTAVIPGYRLLFKGSKSGSYLTIEKEEGCEVPVGVWEVSKRDEERLDRYEGYPAFYYKRHMDITYKDFFTGEEHKVIAFVYIMHEDRRCGIPTRQYIKTCSDGYCDFVFDTNYLRKALRDTEKEMYR